MYMNYPYTQQQPYMQARPTYIEPTLKGRPVSSPEEARATTIDFDGSVFYFPDLANKKIYTKQINLDGTASINVYELKEKPIDPPISYVTREEFESVINQLKASFIQPHLSQVEQKQQEKTPIPNF